MKPNRSDYTKGLLESINCTKLAAALRTLAKEQGEVQSGGVLAIAARWKDLDTSQFKSCDFGETNLNFGICAVQAANVVAKLFERRRHRFQEIAGSQCTDGSYANNGSAMVFESVESEPYHIEVYIGLSRTPSDVDEALLYVIGEMLGLKTPKYKNPLIPRARELLAGAVNYKCVPGR